VRGGNGVSHSSSELSCPNPDADAFTARGLFTTTFSLGFAEDPCNYSLKLLSSKGAPPTIGTLSWMPFLLTLRSVKFIFGLLRPNHSFKSSQMKRDYLVAHDLAVVKSYKTADRLSDRHSKGIKQMPVACAVWQHMLRFKAISVAELNAKYSQALDGMRCVQRS